ncbi:TrkH family potassium uptake protein [Desulforamulus aeronauticus]|uniref:Trk system potassium uptake protein TrkH n=1 Tax=Desulforamulus aeronauticus DSM 10349 TaxID=1121421 RepID=A0A1M6W6E3_9FIRM|nr:TrkH family potassium uptake protein [Desulforamulus aeronauticus]SHK89354.1 trk system potassium uptake protein TrkH [Desulforamulus aeronauticus DSM 10349]
MQRLSGFLNHPARVLVLGFLCVILVGAFLLALPISSASKEYTNFLSALFTSTSAVCVTGLVVMDTGTHWSTFGHVVIMALIQIGGLGFMTMAVLFALLMGRRISFRERLLIQQSLNVIDLSGLVRLAKQVILITLTIQLLVALLLMMRWIPEFGPIKGIWFGIFHAVSGFNNAGFDLMGNFKGLTSYVGDPIVNIAITMDIILGGIGFTVIVDILRFRQTKKLTVHTRFALLITAGLLILGTVVIFFLELNNTLAPLDFGTRLWASWFQAVTPRTAGFNTIDIAVLRPATLFFMVLLMFIGASPGSTGGGIKTTTFGMLVLAVISLAKGKEDAELFRRRLPTDLIYKGLSIVLLAMLWVVFATLALSITEKADFLVILFEVVSAFGTVGLTAGLTTKLTSFGQIIIIITMFIGRLGPLTLAFALASRLKRKDHIRYPEERIIIG